MFSVQAFVKFQVHKMLVGFEKPRNKNYETQTVQKIHVSDIFGTMYKFLKNYKLKLFYRKFMMCHEKNLEFQCFARKKSLQNTALDTRCRSILNLILHVCR